MLTWTVSEQQADYIMKVLMGRPWGEVNPLIVDLMNQSNPNKIIPPATQKEEHQYDKAPKDD